VLNLDVGDMEDAFIFISRVQRRRLREDSKYNAVMITTNMTTLTLNSCGACFSKLSVTPWPRLL
jgi:hypothetical protein